MMMVILSEPDEGYSRNASFALHVIYYICFSYFKETRTVFTFKLYPFDLTGI